MLLLVDNGSAFTPDISGCLESLGVGFECLHVHELGPPDACRYDSFILSGRRRNTRATNRTNAGIILHCVSSSKPLLGICYGAELMVLALGGTIRRMDEPIQGRREVRITRPNPLCDGQVVAYESHMYELASLGPHIQSVAESDTCRHEIVMHNRGRIFGTQFHPEMTPDGRNIIRKFVNTFNK